MTISNDSSKGSDTDGEPNNVVTDDKTYWWNRDYLTEKITRPVQKFSTTSLDLHNNDPIETVIDKYHKLYCGSQSETVDKEETKVKVIDTPMETCPTQYHDSSYRLDYTHFDPDNETFLPDNNIVAGSGKQLTIISVDSRYKRNQILSYQVREWHIPKN